MKIVLPETDSDIDVKISNLAEEFCNSFKPVEEDSLFILQDQRTGAYYTECHIDADKLIEFGTDDVALDPDSSGEYRANRSLVDDHAAFELMRADAKENRSFSNLVCEYDSGSAKPLKVIGGQHRFNAIKDALDDGVNMQHGAKVYFGLDNEQRLDVQVISNTNISVSKDLLDRMYETIAGAELRKWCQATGLLGKGEDFADKRQRGAPLTVGAARNFIINFYAGKAINDTDFEHVATTPSVVKTGVREPAIWMETKKEHPNWLKDPKLRVAGKEFAKLRSAQESAFIDKITGNPLAGSADSRDKANNIAILSAWAYVSGLLQGNDVRLQRHYNISCVKKGDPLRADQLAKGRHASDAENYRGLGYRTDPQERGRFVELFWLQAEKGNGISAKLIDAAIGAFHAKQANIKAKQLKEKL